ncbi:MAG: alpha/beta fold hydrolase [Planctomycetes bacterium]|nr:alpha/beta fold hydrolase [Planctomycetota bacterium]
MVIKRVSVTNCDLNVVDVGSGKPLLLVHGFPLDHTMWRGQIDGLSSTYRVIAPDLRGFGQSNVTSGTVTMKQFADDLAEMLDELKIDAPIAFCGLSMGGYIAWQFVQRHASRLSHLILCDTRAIADSEEGARDRLAFADRVLSDGAGAIADAMMPRLFAKSTNESNRHIVDATREVMLATNPEGIAAALRGMAQREDVTDRIASIDVLTLVICGEFDAISPPAEMRGIAKAIRNSRYVEIAGAGHMAPLENPVVVNEAIRQCLG